MPRHPLSSTACLFHLPASRRGESVPFCSCRNRRSRPVTDALKSHKEVKLPGRIARQSGRYRDLSAASVSGILSMRASMPFSSTSSRPCRTPLTVEYTSTSGMTLMLWLDTNRRRRCPLPCSDSASVRRPTDLSSQQPTLRSVAHWSFLYGGLLIAGGGFFFNSVRITSTAFSSCGSWPARTAAGSCSTSMSGATPSFSTTHFPSGL